METMTTEIVCAEMPIINAEAAEKAAAKAAEKAAKAAADKAKRQAKAAAKKAEAEAKKAEAAKAIAEEIKTFSEAGADPTKAAAGKVINAERKKTIDADKEEITSFTSMKKRLLQHGKGYIYAIGMRYSVAEQLTPAQIKPHQSNKERFRSEKQADGTYIDHELPWTFRKFLLALERMAKKQPDAF